MTEASTSAAVGSTATESVSSASTFIESSSAYHVGKSERELSDHDEEDEEEDDEEKLFAELDRELDMMEDESNFGDHKGDTVASFDMAEFRERRMEELRQEIASHKSTTTPTDLSSLQHTSTASMKGLLTELTHEKDLIQFSSTERQVAIHFFHPKFSRCTLLDRHLTLLARLHPTTLFLKANVLNCPFLTAKLKVSVLPCLITFKDGISKDKIVGFEELGNSDSFSTGALEWRLGQSGIIDPRENRKPIFGFAEQRRGGEGVGKGVVGARRDEVDEFWHDE
ncbi:related to PLP1-protein involved in actin and tubulin folding [Sporisorium scitamineum]|uniref:Related to PLP1-protein involved in actin and tubulin folding n=1 Tax=Sporisorium scitamineum TaxID=49012 RepID=A0A0F7SBE4_9BASI|nr:related to PLP1-protein involved in actin and tubulin folding [Sporisorium scitamineum]CDW98048.1 hypothetical protein [Sporisorium scitamineum]